MGRTAVTAFLVVLLLGMGASPLFNVHDAAPSALEETTSPAYTSNLQLAFSNGPASGTSLDSTNSLSPSQEMRTSHLSS
jgi:hypothetical protein